VRESQSDAVKLGQAERATARSQKAAGLRDGVDAIIKSRDSEIKDLSEQLFVTEKVIRALVNGETHYKKRREPNLFNALVHKATDEMNMGNVASTLILSGKSDKVTNTFLDLGPGDRYNLKDIQDSMKSGMKNDDFSEAYKNDALQMLKDSRGLRNMGSRSSNTAAYADARATTASLTDEASPSCHLYLLF
jgi:hypothetical protein